MYIKTYTTNNAFYRKKVSFYLYLANIFKMKLFYFLKHNYLYLAYSILTIHSKKPLTYETD